MSAEVEDRTFERWALAGAGVLALAGIAAFAARHDAPSRADPAARAPSDQDLLRVRIGGERPPRQPPGDAAQRVVPDPGPAPPEPSPPVDPPQTSPRTVIVGPGETLGQIALRELGTVRRLPEIVELNGIADPDRVRAGTELKLPPR